MTVQGGSPRARRELIVSSYGRKVTRKYRKSPQRLIPRICSPSAVAPALKASPH
ncbi:hypothetical protein HMPREF9568_02305 [Cutibacterium acnes HL013PA2]|nr:hypothetical protein HMPREF9569_01976 [Cutibacterium acnes HL078PA1]EGE89840.1 hypothetical protein HMPREF9568_02305 [Cutibacterium acnes HL013PA2]